MESLQTWVILIVFIGITIGTYKAVFFPKKNKDRYERNRMANGKNGTKK